MSSETEFKKRLINDMSSRVHELLQFYRDQKDLTMMFYAEIHKKEWLRFSIPEEGGDRCMKIAILIPEGDVIQRYTIFVEKNILFVSDDADDYSIGYLQDMCNIVSNVYGNMLLLIGRMKESN